jgi:hypothetical protein
VRIIVDDIIYDLKYSLSTTMDSLVVQALKASGKHLAPAESCVILGADEHPLLGELLVKDYAGQDVLRLRTASNVVEAPPKATAAVISDLLGFVVPSTPENDAFFGSLNSRLDRKLIEIDTCNTPMRFCCPVSPVQPSIICSIFLHKSLKSSFGAPSKKTFSWDSSITCEAAVSKASSHWFPGTPASTFMFKAHGRFECEITSFTCNLTLCLC